MGRMFTVRFGRLGPPALFSAFALSLAATSCSRCSPNGPAEDRPAPGASTDSSADAADPRAAGRCTLLGAPRIVGALAGEDAAASEGPAAYGAEIGGAVADARSFVLGLRTAGLTGVAQVVELSLDGGAPHVLATLPTMPGGARAPLLAVGSDGARLVGTLSIEERSRTFHLSRLGEDAALAPLGDIVQGKDESEVTAFGGRAESPLVAWDDADEKLRVGRVRAVVLGKTKETKETKETKLPKAAAGKDAGPTDEDVASPITSDAAWPMLVPSPAGDRAVLVWSSERPESEAADGGEGEPSQALAFRWVEAVVVDLATGARLGAARALTPHDGHAQTFAAAWGDAGLVLAVRDDPRPTDGDGGTLWAVRLSIDPSGSLGEPTRLSVSDKDVAPGVAAVLGRPGGAWISWLAQDGTSHLFPAFTPGKESVEPALHERRIVASRGDRVLASRLVGSGIELSVLRCSP